MNPGVISAHAAGAEAGMTGAGGRLTSAAGAFCEAAAAPTQREHSASAPTCPRLGPLPAPPPDAGPGSPEPCLLGSPPLIIGTDGLSDPRPSWSE